MMNNADDPVKNWESPVKECFEEAHKKARLAFECGTELEEVCLNYFKNNGKNHKEALKLKGSFETRLSGDTSTSRSFSILPPAIFSLLVIKLLVLSVRVVGG